MKTLDGVIVRMCESKRADKDTNLSTIGLAGCTACVIVGHEFNFIAHVTSHGSKRIAHRNISAWESIAEKIGAKSITIYMGLFMDEDETPNTHEETAMLQKIISFPTEMRYYNIDDENSNGTISVKGNEVTEINSILTF